MNISMIFRWVLLVPILLLVSCAAAQKNKPVQTPQLDSSVPDPSKYEQIVIVGTNDFHGYLRTQKTNVSGETLLSGGAEWFAGYVRLLEKQYGDRLVLLDGGDIFQGTLESNYFQGESTLEFYNSLPYRAAAVGNHEFDYGPYKKGEKDRLGAIKSLMRKAKFPFLSANTYKKGTKTVWSEENLYPSILVQAGSLKIGILGLTTMSTVSKTLPQNIVSLEFGDLREATLREAQALRNRGADLVLITAHEGGIVPIEPIASLLASIPPGTIDAVVSGHHHVEVAQSIAGVPVIQSRTQGKFFGRIDLFVNLETKKVDKGYTRIHKIHAICGNWYATEDSCDPKIASEMEKKNPNQVKTLVPLRSSVYMGESVRKDERVSQAMDYYFKQVDVLREEVLGEVLKDSIEVYGKESQVGEVFLDAFAAKFPKANIIYLNGGGFRKKLTQGTITYGHLFEIHPFDNFSVQLKMTGKQIRAMVEVGVSGANSIPSIKGIKVSYSPTDNPKFDRDLNGDGKKEKWERNRLLSLTLENGKAIKDTDVFFVATNDYLVSGGDNLKHVFDQIPMGDRNYLELNQRDVAAEYLRKNPGLKLPVERAPRITEVVQ